MIAGGEALDSLPQKVAPPPAQLGHYRVIGAAGRREEQMPLRGKVFIPGAATGSIHPPTMSPHWPLTPDEIARDAIAAAEAGAAILHLHARDPKDGRPTPDPDVFMRFLPRVKQGPGEV